MSALEASKKKSAPPIDWLAAVLIGALGAALAVGILEQIGTLFFYQNFAPEIIYKSCGLGFFHPGEIPLALRDFLLVQSQTFDCSVLDGAAELGPSGYFSRLQLYLSLAISFLWHGPVLEYRALWPIVALFSAAYSAGSFVLFRLFLPRLPAIFGGVVIAISPIALTLTLSFRDYSKAPFFIWGLVLLICVIRARAVRYAILWAAAAGATLGIGLGFRTDLIVLLIAGCLSLVAITRWSDLRLRLPSLVIFVVTAIGFAWPVLNVGSGSSFGSVVMQGLSDPFQRFIGLDNSIYGLGARYSDELALSSVAAKERPTIADWDENEAEALYGISQSITLSGHNVMGWLPLFAGDFATQGLKSLVWLTSMPALIANDRPIDPSFGGTVQSAFSFPGRLIYDVVGHSWLVGLGIVGMVAFVWRELSLRARYFPATLVLVGVVVASSTAQFAVRHIFHLEFLWLLSLLSLVMAWIDRDRLRSVFKPVVAGLIAFGVLVAAVYAGMVFHQQNALKEAFSDLLALPRETVASSTQHGAPSGFGSIVLEVPVPNDHVDIVQAPDDSMNNKIPLGGLQWDVRAEADRMILSFDDCPPADYEVKVGYAKSSTAWQPMDEVIIVPIAKQTGDVTQLLFSAFYRPTQHFSGVTVRPYSGQCRVELQRVRGDTPIPFIANVRFAPNWRMGQLYRGFGGFGAINW